MPFIELSSIYCWSDAVVVLHSLHGNGKRPDAFVRSRVDEFQKLVGVDYWHHVESKLNPDLLFRGHLFSEILHYDFEDHHLFY